MAPPVGKHPLSLIRDDLRIPPVVPFRRKKGQSIFSMGGGPIFHRWVPPCCLVQMAAWLAGGQRSRPVDYIGCDLVGGGCQIIARAAATSHFSKYCCSPPNCSETLFRACSSLGA
jgi:hypothetical protein